MAAGFIFCPESQKIRDQDSLEQQEVVSDTNSDASAWVVYGLGNNGYEIKLSSAADNSAPVLGTVTADNQN